MPSFADIGNFTIVLDLSLFGWNLYTDMSSEGQVGGTVGVFLVVLN